MTFFELIANFKIKMSELKEPVRYIPIKNWANEDRPREKLSVKGRAALSDAELLAIILGSGSRSQSAVELSKTILASVKYSLCDLGRLEYIDFCKFKGIGDAKALTILAAMELGRRRKEDPPNEKPTIKSSRDAFLLLQPNLVDLPYEEFWILLLNRANMVIEKLMISRGGLNGTVADTRLIMKYALEKMASGIILSHNHPSGNLKPSTEDLALTAKLQKAAKLLDMTILDHIIISHSGYFSFADNGEI